MLDVFTALFVCVLAASVAAYLLSRNGLDRRLRSLQHGVHVVSVQLEVLLMASEELKAVLARIDAATNNIAEDIRRIKEQIGTGMTSAEVAEVQAEAEALAVKLEALAADTEDPIPDEPV
jgi:uncharacterized coiled-coil DUF342 family protein